MAKIRNDILLQGLSSTTGQGLTAERTASGRPILSIPLTVDEKYRVSKALAESHAAAYLSYQGVDDKTAAALMAPDYMLESVDMFHGLEIREVDPSDWHGEAGQVIRLHARHASDPIVVITDGEGRVIEQGRATGADGDLWTYTTSTTAPEGPRLIVTARDLPRHLEQVWLA